MLDWSEYTRFLIALFAIIEPFSIIPIFMSLTEGQSITEKAQTASAASLTLFIVLLIFSLAGEVFLGLLGTSLDAFRVGGGIVLLLMSFSMLNAEISNVKQTAEEADQANFKKAVGVVPLGLPLLAGPGAISTTVILAEQGNGPAHHFSVIGAIILMCFVTRYILRLAVPIANRLGMIGLNIVTRVFGLLLAAISVEIMAAGLKGLFPLLAG